MDVRVFAVSFAISALIYFFFVLPNVGLGLGIPLVMNGLGALAGFPPAKGADMTVGIFGLLCTAAEGILVPINGAPFAPPSICIFPPTEFGVTVLDDFVFLIVSPSSEI